MLVKYYFIFIVKKNKRCKNIFEGNREINKTETNWMSFGELYFLYGSTNLEIQNRISIIIQFFNIPVATFK